MHYEICEIQGQRAREINVNLLHGDQKVSVYLMITVQKVKSNA
jgi:hypothetical protein